VSALQADLDGNGRRDTILLWRPPITDVIGEIEHPEQVGAVALVDDGTFHLLEEPPAKWPRTELGEAVGLFDATRVVRFGADAREQVVVAILIGANTTHYVVLGMGADRRLHTLSTADPGPAQISRGGGAGYESDFGCVTSSGRPLLALTGSVTDWGGSGVTSYAWNRDFYELNDLQLRQVGHEGGLAVQTRGPEAGSDCSAPDAAHRGPEIGPTGLADTTPETSARSFVTAVLRDDRSGVSRYLAGDLGDVGWTGQVGIDAWRQARIATQSDRGAWGNASSRCAPPSAVGPLTVTTCEFATSASPIRLYVGLVESGGRWLVARAVGLAGS
jgi:hypothetical protein